MSENSTLPADQKPNPEELVSLENSTEETSEALELDNLSDLTVASESEVSESSVDNTNSETEFQTTDEEPIIEAHIPELVEVEENEDSEVEDVEIKTEESVAEERDFVVEIKSQTEPDSVVNEIESEVKSETVVPEIHVEDIEIKTEESLDEAGHSVSEVEEEKSQTKPDSVVNEIESEAKLETVVPELHAEADLLSVNEQDLEELEKAEAEIHIEDYSGLDKEQIVKLAEQLNRDNDPGIALRAIQKLKPLFDTLYNQDKNEALEKFTAEGNPKESFEYKFSNLEARFHQASKGIYEKRKISQEFQVKERSKNLEQKLNLLEQLRKLVDDHEHTPGYDKFKEIREEWKKIGPVGPEHAQNLNASYYSLIERFYSLSEIYHNMRDFDRKKNLELKLELISKIEKLAEEPMISKAMKDLMTYQDDYRSLGPIPKEKLDEIKERLKKAVDVLYDKRRVFNEERKHLIAEEVSLKEAIVSKLPDFEVFISNSTKEWQAKTQELLALQEEWKTIPGRFREKTQDLNKQFWGAYKKFMHNKNEFFKNLDKGKKDVLAQKQALVDEVSSLKDGEDWDGIANRMKQLQTAWKEIAPAFGKEGQKVYEDFKAGIDHFFTRLREQRSGEDKVQSQNLQEKEAICTELEGLATSGKGTKDLIDQLKEKFRNIGFVPMKSIQKVNGRFSKAMMDLIESSTLIPKGDKERFKINILSNRSTYSMEGVKTLKNQEGYIQKRLQQLKKDVGNLEDNVSMFKMSKNAMAMIEDIQKRISLSKLEIKELESQLKEIRSGEKVS